MPDYDMHMSGLKPVDQKSIELQLAEGKQITPNGVSQNGVFESILEGNLAQATESVARVSPEELIQSVEKAKRERLAKTLSKVLSDKQHQTQTAPDNGFRKLQSDSTNKSSRATDLKNLASKFFGLILNAERDMFRIEEHIQRIGVRPEAWSPAQLFLIQVRVAHVSQQIELFTSMLNKALESSKQLFNTQI